MHPVPAAAEPVLYEVEAMRKLANWRPLVQWFLAIPHWIIASILNSVSGVLALISFFAILFTGNIPAGLFDFQVMTFRYRARVTAYSMFFHDKYPPFDFTTSADDPGGDPLRFSIEHPPKFNRWLPLVKWLFIIPHLLLLIVLAIGGFFVGLWAVFAVLFTGNYPPAAQSYLIRLNRYGNRILAYLYLISDHYPKFGLQ